MSRNSLEERLAVVRRTIKIYKKMLMDCADEEKQKELNYKLDLLKQEEQDCLKDMGALE